MLRSHDEPAVLTIDVEGPATMLESPAVRETASERLAAHGPCALRIDLRDCTTMDSTFSGTLLSLKRQVDKIGGTLTLVSPSEKVLELLRQMGLEDFYNVDVADRIAVLNKGRIEQVGSPTEVYDSPSNPFVMSFLGAVSTLNGTLVRPHDIRVGRTPDMAISQADGDVAATGVLRAKVDRVVVLGFEVRVELTTAADHTPFTAQITRGDAEALRLIEGDTVYVRATRIPPIAGQTQEVEAVLARA